MNVQKWNGRWTSGQVNVMWSQDYVGALIPSDEVLMTGMITIDGNNYKLINVSVSTNRYGYYALIPANATFTRVLKNNVECVVYKYYTRSSEIRYSSVSSVGAIANPHLYI